MHPDDAAPRVGRSGLRVGLGYLLAVVLTAAAVGVRYLMGIGDGTGSQTLPAYALVVLVSAYVGGLGPGLFATVFSLAAATYLTIAPLYTFEVADPTHLIALSYSAVLGVAASLGLDALHRARLRAEVVAHQNAVTLGSIADAVVTADVEGRVTFLNAAAERLTGWRSSAAVGRALGEVVRLLDVNTRQPLPDRLVLVRESGESVMLDGAALLVSREGIEFPIADSAAPVRDAQGRMVGMVLVLRSAAAALAAEEEARERMRLQAELRTIGELVEGGVFTYRIPPGSGVPVHYMAPGLRALFGATESDDFSDPERMMRQLPPEDQAMLRERIRESIEEERPGRATYRVIRPDGSVRWVESVANPVRDPDGSVSLYGFAMDITERQRTAEELRSARETLSLLIAQAPIAIAMFDRDMHYLAASHRYLDAFARGNTDVVGRGHYDLLPDMPERWRALHQEVLRGEVRKNDHDVWVQGDGTERHLRWAMHPWQRSDGSIGGLILYAEDITASAEAVRAVAASERRYRDLVTMSPEAIYLIRDGIVTFANEAGLALLGATAPSGVVGHRALAFLPEEEQPDVLAGYEAIAQGRQIPARRRRFLRVDGSTIIADTMARLYTDADGPVAQVLARDVTDVMRQEEALRESTARFRQLTESMREAFWLSDLTRTRMRYLSPAGPVMFGRTVDAFLGALGAWRAMTHVEDRDRVDAELQKVAGGARAEIEYRIVRPDGRIHWVRDHVSPVREPGGSVIGLAGVAEDVTERRALESQLLQSRKLESIGELAAGVAHDFNNWITVIQMTTELLERALPPGASAAGPLVQEIRHAGDRAAGITRQLLAFSRQQQVQPRVLDLNAVVLENETMLRRLCGDDVALLVVRGAIGAVRADPVALSQVLLNLTVNAREAMPKGGTITVETREDSAEAMQHRTAGRWMHGPAVCLVVADDGEGMAPEVLARIFEPFFTTRGRGRGSGLGLSVVHGIVEQCGGEVLVDSQPGAGTTFTLAFPRSSEPVVVPKPASGSTAGGTESILVVEDDAPVRRTTVRALRLAGYEVREAANADDALALFERGAAPCRLLLVDIVLPEVSGPELARRLGARYPDMRVLFTSGHVDDARLRGLTIPVGAAFLPKPFSIATLLAKVRETIDRAR